MTGRARLDRTCKKKRKRSGRVDAELADEDLLSTDSGLAPGTSAGEGSGVCSGSNNSGSSSSSSTGSEQLSSEDSSEMVIIRMSDNEEVVSGEGHLTDNAHEDDRDMRVVRRRSESRHNTSRGGREGSRSEAVRRSRHSSRAERDEDEEPESEVDVEGDCGMGLTDGELGRRFRLMMMRETGPRRERDTIFDKGRMVNNIPCFREGSEISKYLKGFEADLVDIGVAKKHYKRTLLNKFPPKTREKIVDLPVYARTMT